MKQYIILLLISVVLTIFIIVGYDLLVRTFGQPQLVRLPQLCIGESENDVICLKNKELRQLYSLSKEIEPPKPEPPKPEEPLQEYFKIINAVYTSNDSLNLNPTMVKDENECKDNCSKDVNCKAYEFDKQTNNCRLVRPIIREDVPTNRPYVYDRINDKFYAVDEMGRVLGGNDYGSVTAETPEQCALKCKEITGENETDPNKQRGCDHFDYVNETKTCYPKYSKIDNTKVIGYKI